ncbi:MAG: DUF5696 domain-containing protein [Planctomycetota bacterium]
MPNITLTERTLSMTVNGRPIEIDLARCLRVHMADRVLDRHFTASGFDVAGVFPRADGLRVHLYHPEHRLLVPLVFRASADGFRVTLPAGQIVEELGINRRLLAVDLLPDFMQTRVGDDGFFLLPCYSGTLVRFADHASTTHLDRLYMDQSQWEKWNLMNCFAVNRNGSSVLAIVHRGDFFCHAVTELNHSGTNRIYARLGIRHGCNDPLTPADKEVVYRFATGRDADYVGLAKTYRSYLLNERGVSPLKDRVGQNPVLAYSTTAMRTKIFFAKKDNQIDGHGKLRVYTTFKQAQTILDRMHAAGLERAVITLVGWNPGGHDGAYPTRFPVEPALGGEDGLRALVAKAKDMGYQIVPHDGVNDVYRISPDFDPEVLVRCEDGQPRVVGVWAGGQSYKACPLVYYDRYGSDVQRVRDLGFEGHYYIDAQPTPMFRCHDPRHRADEEAYAMALCRMTQLQRALYGAISTETGPTYNLPFVDEVAHLPSAHSAQRLIPKTPPAFQRIMDRIVPFYQIAVHGLVTYQEGWVHGYRQDPGGTRQGLSRLMGWGARPCMEVSYCESPMHGQYEASIRDVTDAYRFAFGEIAETHAELIEDYEECGPESARITYANGRVARFDWHEAGPGDPEPQRWTCE